MRISPAIQKLNARVVPHQATPGQKYYRLYDFFTTQDGQWDTSAAAYSIPQWARDTYLRPWGAPDYFDDAGGDHHLFGAIYDPATKQTNKAAAIRYWTHTDNANHTVQPVKIKSGWANIVVYNKFYPDKGETGAWSWRPEVAGVPADVVMGGGMPYGLHVSFFATWELATASGTEQPPTTDQRIVKLETWARAISAKYPGGPQYE